MTSQHLTVVVLIAVVSFFTAAILTSPPRNAHEKRKSKFQESWSIALYLTSGLCFYITIAVSVLAAIINTNK
jgi:hypothetical protein